MIYTIATTGQGKVFIDTSLPHDSPPYAVGNDIYLHVPMGSGEELEEEE